MGAIKKIGKFGLGGSDRLGHRCGGRDVFRARFRLSDPEKGSRTDSHGQGRRTEAQASKERELIDRFRSGTNDKSALTTSGGVEGKAGERLAEVK